MNFNQDLIELIEQDQVQNDLHSIKDYLRWVYSNFNRSDIFFGHGQDNPWDETIQLVLGGLQLPLDIPTDLYEGRLTQSERQRVITLLIARLSQRIPTAY